MEAVLGWKKKKKEVLEYFALEVLMCPFLRSAAVREGERGGSRDH